VTEVYIPDIVRQVRAWLSEVLPIVKDTSLRSYLSKIGEVIHQAVTHDDQRIRPVINNYHPQFLGASWSEILAKSLTLDEALDASAYYFGFAGYEEVPDLIIDRGFEEAIDLMLTGDMPSFIEVIENDKSLLNKRSQFGHQATLWHYLGSNGVEIHRQVVPINIVEIIQLFLDWDIDPSVTMEVYGGQHTMKQLLVTSAHPREAGVLEKCIDILKGST